MRQFAFDDLTRSGNQAFWAQAALGAGFKAVLFTDIRSAEDVDECHAYIRPDTPGADARMEVKLRRPAEVTVSLRELAQPRSEQDCTARYFCESIEVESIPKK